MNRKWSGSGARLGLAAGAFALCLPAAAFAGDVLILESTVTGGLASPEATEVANLGHNPVLLSDAAWGALTGADFAAAEAIVIGDPTCGTDTSHYAAALANRNVWGPEITGNVAVNVTDPTYHDGQGGRQLTASSIAFAVDADTTGAYISLSCSIFEVPQAAPVNPEIIDVFGTWEAFGQLGGCPASIHIVAVHPALSGLTDGDLSNWGCSAHGGFSMWPAEFNVLAIATDLPSAYEASDGTTGLPYVMARGEELTPIACGDGEVVGDEECDDGNMDPADLCSNTCRLTYCGDGTVQQPNGRDQLVEQCDDGNNVGGDGCNERCQLEEPSDCGCLDKDKDGYPTYYGPCEVPSGGDKHNQWIPECESFNDCNDDDPTVHPFAVEIPGDGIDQNCNSQMQCGAFDDDDAAAKFGALLFAIPVLGIFVIRRRLRA